MWLVEGEEEGCEGEKGCIYVMGSFDNSIYKTLQGNYRYIGAFFERDFLSTHTFSVSKSEEVSSSEDYNLLLLFLPHTYRIVGPSVILAHIQHGWVSMNSILSF